MGWDCTHPVLYTCSLPLCRVNVAQLEQEMDMILEKNDVFSGAIQTWNKWVPVIMEYTGSLSGRKASVVCDIRKKCEGELVFSMACSYTCHRKNKFIYIRGGGPIVPYI